MKRGNGAINFVYSVSELVQKNPCWTWRKSMQNVFMHAAIFFIKHGKFRHLVYIYFECILESSDKKIFTHVLKKRETIELFAKKAQKYATDS